MPAPDPSPGPGPAPTVQERLASGEPCVSFEFFPPKDDAGEAVLWDAVRRLEPLAPTFVSVTYGAGGSTRDRTTRITAGIVRSTTLTPVAHLTCVGATRDELRQVIGGYADAGVSTVLALRGDPPGGPGTPFVPVPGGPANATELVELIRGISSFSVGVAAYPDGYPGSPDLDHDVEVLCRKADAGAGFAVTQFFFDPEAYLGLVSRLRARGCTMPVVPGIMPVTSYSQLQRFATLSGRELPADMRRRLDAVADDPAAVRAVGVELATALCRDLLDGGAPGLHFYTLNRSTATLEIVGALGLVAPDAAAR